MWTVQIDVSRIAIQVGIYIVYGITSAKQCLFWIIVYIALNIVIMSFFLIMAAYFTCCRSRYRYQHSSQENTTANNSDVNYYTVDSNVQPRERKSNYSVDTDFEFSYYDPIDNRPSSNVATMKLLGSP